MLTHDELIQKARQNPAVRAEYARLKREEMPQAGIEPQNPIKLDSLLSEIGRRLKLTEDEFAVFEGIRDKSPARAAKFE